MPKTILHYTLLLVIMVLSQAIVFNHLCLFGVAVPLVFIYFILSLPADLKVNYVVSLAFITGLIVDIFSDTPGMNALCCTILGLVRHPVLGLYIQRDEDMAERAPSISTLGIAVYIKFVLTMTLIYCTMFFVIEAMTFSFIGLMLMRIVASTILTSLLIVAINSIRPKV